MTGVSSVEERLTIPTYLVGEPNLNPVILGYRGVKSYPYLIRDELTDIREDVAYDALILENEYLKVTVLPGLGGRLYSALDKRNGREIFYKNRVIKPQLIGLTGAWFAGGIEWNFPRGHRPSTMERVEACHRCNSDGSVSVFVGEYRSHLRSAVRGRTAAVSRESLHRGNRAHSQPRSPAGPVHVLEHLRRVRDGTAGTAIPDEVGDRRAHPGAISLAVRQGRRAARSEMDREYARADDHLRLQRRAGLLRHL